MKPFRISRNTLTGKERKRIKLALLGSKGKNMTEGNILSLLVLFALPLMIGNFFQILYNTVDSLVVGNFVGKSALGAVGSVGSIVNTVVSIFSGLSAGAGAVISQHFGAGNDKNVKSAVHISIVLTVIIGIVSSLAGYFFADEFLHLTKTPIELYPNALLYLRIYFLGMIGLFIYNIEAGILRAIGDSANPFYALVISSIVNLVLDLVFVLCFDMGVEGVAYATVIAQIVSSIFLAVILIRANGSHKVTFKDVDYSKDITKTIIRIGIPTALHLGIVAFSNVFVQAYINAFGDNITTAWSVYSKVDHIVILPIQSISIAITTFVGQNLGAGKIDRVKKGIKTSVILNFAIIAVLMVPLLIFAREIISIFNSDDTIIKYGAYLLRLVTPFYLFMCINQNLAGALRGAGLTKIPMIMALASFVCFRQIYLYVLSLLGLSTNLTLVALSFPFGWIVCAIAYMIYYRVSHWEEKASLTRASK